MKKIFASQVQVGMVLPCDIYNEQGVLLWAQGARVNTEQQANKLIKEGFRSDLQEWIPPKTSSKVIASPEEKPVKAKLKKSFVYNTVLDALTEIQLPLVYIFDVLKTDSFFKEKQSLTTQIQAIADVVLDICEKHPHEALATIHMHSQGKYIILQALYRSLMAGLICHLLRLSETETRSITCSALSANAAIIKLSETLSKQSKSMNQEQREEYEAAPANSLLYLTRCGVRDETWLESVYMQNENLDGSGFPRGLKEDEISQGAKILAIANQYVDYILPSPGKHPTFDPPTALKRLYKRHKNQLDRKIIVRLINYFGVVPPGTFVALKDGGIGIVILHSKEKNKPIITKVGDKITNFYSEFNITLTLPYTEIIRPPSNIPKKLFRLWGIYFSEHQPNQ